MATFVGSGSSEYISSVYGVSSTVTSDPLYSIPGSASDTIFGNGGEDNINAAGGNDIIYTGAGNDIAYGGAGDDFFDDYTDSSFGGSDTFYGGAGNDTIYGWTGYDTLYGDEGNDLLYGEGDDDTLNGGVGADQMYGGDGSDTYYVDNVGDLVVDDGSGYGYDRVNSAIAFTLGAGLEALTLIGRLAINGTGNELGNDLTGNDSANSLYGLAGNDYLNGGAGADTLDGGDGNDNLSGGSGVDTLLGGTGNDYFSGSAEADTLNGGTGNDTYYLESASNVVVETLLQSQGGGIDTVEIGYDVSSYTLGDNVENLQIYWYNSGQTATGNALANVMNGGYGPDRLNGLAGNDTLHGDEGADILDGGAGADTMRGGYDNDTYLVDQSTDVVIEDYSWEGRDVVNSTASFTLGANVDDLTLLGSGALNGTGNSGANLIIGTTGVNTLRGLDGADTFRSQSGADIVVGGNGADIFQYQAVSGSNPTQRDSIRSGDGAGAFQGVGAPAGDRFDLSLLDADTTVSGVQDFVFGTATGRGRLWATTVGTSTYINGNTDSDTAIEFQVAIDDGLVTHTAYTSADFLL